MARSPRRPKHNPLEDPAFTAQVERLIAEQRSTVLPSDQALTDLATVKESDIDRAERLWDEANRGTDVEGLLSAKTEVLDDGVPPLRS